jgi:hypothetical protein
MHRKKQGGWWEGCWGRGALPDSCAGWLELQFPRQVPKFVQRLAQRHTLLAPVVSPLSPRVRAKMCQVGDKGRSRLALAPSNGVDSSKAMVTKAESRAGGRGIDGGPDQITRNSWHPAFEPTSLQLPGLVQPVPVGINRLTPCWRSRVRRHGFATGQKSQHGSDVRCLCPVPQSLRKWCLCESV